MKVTAELKRPPPFSTAVLPVKVLPITVTVPPFSLPRPPPPAPLKPAPGSEELPTKTLSRTVAVAPLWLARPPPLVAALPENTTLLTVSAPKLSMPPPLPVPALPPAIVRPEMDTVRPDSTLRTREVWLPLTVSRSAPGPLIFRSSVTSSSPLVRAIVPVSPGWKMMMSAPAWALAWARAARSEPGPPSARVVTWKADGTMRSDSHSSAGTKRFPQDCLRPVRETGPDFPFSKRCNQDSAMRSTFQERKPRDKRPPAGAREHHARAGTRPSRCRREGRFGRAVPLG